MAPSLPSMANPKNSTHPSSKSQNSPRRPSSHTAAPGPIELIDRFAISNLDSTTRIRKN